VRYRGGVVAAWSPAAVCIAIVALLGAAAAAWWAIEQSRAPSPADHPEGAPAPRRRPVMEPWMVAVAALLVAGLILAPRLIGVTFLFLPFLWGNRRRGHGGRDRERRSGEDPAA
jgi:hypothetical protein